MKIMSTYSVKIKEYNHIFKDTIRLYRRAVDFYIQVILNEWDQFAQCSNQKQAVQLAEGFSVMTKNRPVVRYDFGMEFYKFPSYLRRTAIAEGYGKVSSYQSNLKKWESADPRQRGCAPSIPKAGCIYPAMYKGNMFLRTDEYKAKLKVFYHNTWDWISVSLRKTDVDYVKRHCTSRKECVPTLQKRGKQWFLDFAFEEKTELNHTEVFDQTVLAVDLGLNNACTCSVMRADGTVLGRRFFRLAREYDSLKRKIDHVKKSQRHGARKLSRQWKLVCGVNDDIAVKTAHFIMDLAVECHADAIVFEHLDLGGRTHGAKKMRLHLWKARYVQSMVTDKAHRCGIRIARVNAWGTSRFAFDGSGRVLRGNESSKTRGSYGLCEFPTGKLYNCDLNASYNIGARYFIREIIKSLPATDGQRLLAKVPEAVHRSTCTLSTLISLDAELHAAV
jgi:IS605 OrfB family transposase